MIVAAAAVQMDPLLLSFAVASFGQTVLPAVDRRDPTLDLNQSETVSRAVITRSDLQQDPGCVRELPSIAVAAPRLVTGLVVW